MRDTHEGACVTFRREKPRMNSEVLRPTVSCRGREGSGARVAAKKKMLREHSVSLEDFL